MNQRFATPSFTLNSGHVTDDHFSSLTRAADKYLISLMDWILDRLESGRDRSMLARMDSRELKDIGLTRSDIERVAAGSDDKLSA